MKTSAEILGHFRLGKMPFADTVNARFFYQTEAAERAFLRMEHCVESGRALGLIWGPSGSGKTLLSQLLLENLDPAKYLPILVLATPRMSKTSVLQELLSELEIQDCPRSAFSMINLVHQHILREQREGRRVIILLDEAHFLSTDALHLLRTLSNLETTDEKLVTVILFAEPGFVKRIQLPTYESLRGRIAFRAKLSPLTVEETEQYVKYRLLMAGGDGTLFATECYRILHDASGGIPRSINRIAEGALLEGFLAGTATIDSEVMLRAVARDGWDQETPPSSEPVERRKKTLLETGRVLQYGS